jgi:hypothetical protein
VFFHNISAKFFLLVILNNFITDGIFRGNGLAIALNRAFINFKACNGGMHCRVHEPGHDL